MSNIIEDSKAVNQSRNKEIVLYTRFNVSIFNEGVIGQKSTLSQQ